MHQEKEDINSHCVNYLEECRSPSLCSPMALCRSNTLMSKTPSLQTTHWFALWHADPPDRGTSWEQVSRLHSLLGRCWVWHATDSTGSTSCGPAAWPGAPQSARPTAADMVAESKERGKQPAEKAHGQVTDNSVIDAVTLIAFKTLNQNTTWYFVWFCLFLAAKNAIIFIKHQPLEDIHLSSYRMAMQWP